MTLLITFFAHRIPSIPARQRTHGLRLLAFAVVAWVLAGAVSLFAFAADNTSPAVSAVPPGGVAAVALPAPEAPPDIDALRVAAAGGSRSAIRELSFALMDRYDLKGDSDDLVEALTWVDREWLQYGDADLTARVVSHYCGERWVRDRPYCNLGE